MAPLAKAPPRILPVLTASRVRAMLRLFVEVRLIR